MIQWKWKSIYIHIIHKMYYTIFQSCNNNVIPCYTHINHGILVQMLLLFICIILYRIYVMQLINIEEIMFRWILELMIFYPTKTNYKNEWECSLVDQFIVRYVIYLCRFSVNQKLSQMYVIIIFCHFVK